MLAVMTYCDRGALVKTILDPELHCTGRVKFEGNLARFMEAIYLGISGKGKSGGSVANFNSRQLTVTVRHSYPVRASA
jgi:hypothetical protein